MTDPEWNAWQSWRMRSPPRYRGDDPIADLRERVATLEVTTDFSCAWISTAQARLTKLEQQVGSMSQWRTETERCRKRRQCRVRPEWLSEGLKFVTGFVLLMLALKGYISPEAIGQIGAALVGR